MLGIEALRRDHGLFAAPRCLTKQGILQILGMLYLADAGDAAKDNKELFVSSSPKPVAGASAAVSSQSLHCTMPDIEDGYDAWGTWRADAKSPLLTEVSANATEAQSAPKPRLENHAAV